jgi:hypothetical protein
LTLVAKEYTYLEALFPSAMRDSKLEDGERLPRKDYSPE